MGIGGSKYRVAVSRGDASEVGKGFEWLAKPGISLGIPLKPESFDNLDAVGKGKFGVVFVAKVRVDFKHVGIKYIPKQTIYDLNSFDKIQTELDLLGKLDHPFAIFCFGAFESVNCLGLVMEFAVGGELYHRVKQRVTISEAEAKFYFVEIASLLRYLHEDLGMVYRDLKPENILLDYAGHVKVCDFGFATLCSKAEADLKDSCGTVMYIAPELINKVKHGFAVDWWALGCVLVEMVTGHAPFGDSDDMNKFEIFNNITEKPVRLPLFMSPSLKTLIKGLLMKDQNERFDGQAVLQCAWLKDIVWKDVNERKLVPPWVPTNAKNQSGSVINFVHWDLSLPTAAPSSDVVNYCRPLRLPKSRGSMPIAAPPAPLDASPSMKGGAMKKAQSSKRGMGLTNQPSNSNLAVTAANSNVSAISSLVSTKVKRMKSTKVSIADDVVEDPDILQDSPVAKPRTKSQLKAGASSSNLTPSAPSSSPSRPESANKRPSSKSNKQRSQAKMERAPSQK